MDREPVPAGWALLSEWWCVPVDMTADERAIFLLRLRTNMGADFAACPLDRIADRLYGGFHCAEGDRRHVCFDTGAYSYIAAGDGHYSPETPEDRAAKWHELRGQNAGQTFYCDGPFSEDAPPVSA